MADLFPDAPLSHADPVEHRRLIALRANNSVQKGGGPGAGLLSTHQQISGAGAIDPTSAVVEITTTGANALTLADGVDHQMLFAVMVADGGAGTLTPDNLANGTTITFDDVGDSAFLLYAAGAWHWMGGTATLA